MRDMFVEIPSVIEVDGALQARNADKATFMAACLAEAGGPAARRLPRLERLSQIEHLAPEAMPAHPNVAAALGLA